MARQKKYKEAPWYRSSWFLGIMLSLLIIISGTLGVVLGIWGIFRNDEDRVFFDMYYVSNVGKYNREVININGDRDEYDEDGNEIKYETTYFGFNESWVFKQLITPSSNGIDVYSGDLEVEYVYKNSRNGLISRDEESNMTFLFEDLVIDTYDNNSSANELTHSTISFGDIFIEVNENSDNEFSMYLFISDIELTSVSYFEIEYIDDQLNYNSSDEINLSMDTLLSSWRLDNDSNIIEITYDNYFGSEKWEDEHYWYLNLDEGNTASSSEYIPKEIDISWSMYVEEKWKLFGNW